MIGGRSPFFSVGWRQKTKQVPRVGQVLAGKIVQGVRPKKTKPVANVNWYLRKLKSQSAVVYAITGFVRIAAMFL